MNIELEIEKLKNADVGQTVLTEQLDDGSSAVVTVIELPGGKKWAQHGSTPCSECVFGCWKLLKKEIDHPDIIGRTIEVNLYEYKCPMFGACNSKDRPDRKSVKFQII